MDPTGGEQAKAIGEVARLAQQVTESFKQLIDPVLKEAGEWGGAVIRSKREEWQLRNLQKVMQMAAEIRQLEPPQGGHRMIEAREIAPFIDAIAVEDDPILQDLWARLISRATDPTTGVDLKRAYIDVLKSIDPYEAKILKGIRDILAASQPFVEDMQDTDLDEFAQIVGLPHSTVTIGLHHLGGLGCVVVGEPGALVAEFKPGRVNWPSISSATVTFAPTLLAASLLNACAAGPSLDAWLS